MDPYKIADRKLTELQDHFRNRERILKSYRLSPEAHNRAVAKMQQEYDEAKYQTATIRSQLDDIKRGIAAGEVDSIAGQKAMLSLVAPRETVEAAFPDPVKQPAPRRGRFTPKEFNTYRDQFIENLKTTIVDPKGWLLKKNRKQADPEKVKEQYFTDRVKYGYNDMSTEEKVGFDQAWEHAVIANPLITKVWAELKKTDPEIFTSQTHDQRLLDLAKKKALGMSPMAASLKPKRIQSMSPIGAVALYGELSNKPKPTTGAGLKKLTAQGPKKLTAQEAKAILENAGGDKDKARQIAKEMGYEF